MSLPSQGRRDRTVRASIFQCRDVLQVWQNDAPSRSAVAPPINTLTGREREEGGFERHAQCYGGGFAGTQGRAHHTSP